MNFASAKPTVAAAEAILMRVEIFMLYVLYLGSNAAEGETGRIILMAGGDGVFLCSELKIVRSVQYIVKDCT